jgi:uncharacterized membrane protein YcaP (DUF421 family)
VLVERQLNRERIAPEDIFSAMHKVGLERLEQVEWAILEGDGKIALIPAAGDPLSSQVTSAAASSSSAVDRR